jgi:hypothetical protein
MLFLSAAVYLTLSYLSAPRGEHRNVLFARIRGDVQYDMIFFMQHSVKHDTRIHENSSERSNGLSQIRLRFPVPGRGAFPCSAVDSVDLRRDALQNTRVQPHVSGQVQMHNF